MDNQTHCTFNVVTEVYLNSWVHNIIEKGLEIQEDTEVHDITEESEQNLINRERYTDRIVEVEHTEEGKETLRRDHL